MKTDMNKLLYFFLILCSCNYQETEKHTTITKESLLEYKDERIDSIVVFSKSVIITNVSNKIVKVEILPNMPLHWDNNAYRILEDSLFIKIKDQFSALIIPLTKQMGNVFETKALICPKKEKLVVGDIAYFLIDRIESIPFMKLTGRQLDIMEVGCPYQIDLLPYIQGNRVKLANSIRKYLLSRK